jgi:hypothetical protein
MDDFHCSDLCADPVVLPGDTGPVTGLPGYQERIKAGKAPGFNMDEMILMDLLCAAS